MLPLGPAAKYASWRRAPRRLGLQPCVGAAHTHALLALLRAATDLRAGAAVVPGGLTPEEEAMLEDEDLDLGADEEAVRYFDTLFDTFYILCSPKPAMPSHLVEPMPRSSEGGAVRAPGSGGEQTMRAIALRPAPGCARPPKLPASHDHNHTHNTHRTHSLHAIHTLHPLRLYPSQKKQELGDEDVNLDDDWGLDAEDKAD